MKKDKEVPPLPVRPCLIKNPGAPKNALLDSHIYPEGSNFIRPPIILSGARNKTVVAVGFSEDRTNTFFFFFFFFGLFILPGTMFGLRRSPTETRGNNSDTVLLFNGQQW